MGATNWGAGRFGVVVARAGFAASTLVVLGSLYCWLYFAEGDIPNLTLGGMAGQTLLALVAFAAGLMALQLSESGRSAAPVFGLLGLLCSAIWLPVVLAVWD